MERETLLATLWNMTDAQTDDAQAAEKVRQRLLSGELQAAGNCRNETASYWEIDE
jgi:hypothetical protein